LKSLRIHGTIDVYTLSPILRGIALEEISYTESQVWFDGVKDADRQRAMDRFESFAPVGLRSLDWNARLDMNSNLVISYYAFTSDGSFLTALDASRTTLTSISLGLLCNEVCVIFDIFFPNLKSFNSTTSSIYSAPMTSSICSTSFFSIQAWKSSIQG
jgi:hypothetical protein